MLKIWYFFLLAEEKNSHPVKVPPTQDCWSQFTPLPPPPSSIPQHIVSSFIASLTVLTCPLSWEILWSKVPFPLARDKDLARAQTIPSNFLVIDVLIKIALGYLVSMITNQYRSLKYPFSDPSLFSICSTGTGDLYLICTKVVERRLWYTFLSSKSGIYFFHNLMSYFSDITTTRVSC